MEEINIEICLKIITNTKGIQNHLSQSKRITIRIFLFGKAKYLLLHSKSISSAKLNTKLCGSDVFLLFELINIA